ncbi:MAG: hypothetical protein LBR26_06040 [Prevotella sp.]|nr:hypothetical protein [Prevotella sp.]
MMKSEYKRYVFSKSTIALLMCLFGCFFIGCMSVLAERNEFLVQLQNPMTDMNVAYTQELVNGYNGFSYIFAFFNSNVHLVFTLILLSGLSLILGKVTWGNIHEGMGNFLVSRLTYKKYIKNILMAQVLYIITVLSAFFLSITIILLVVFPMNPLYRTTTSFPLDNETLLGNLLICLSFYVLTCIYMILVIVLTSLITFWVHNKYLIQTVPIVIYLIPLLLASTVGNLSSGAGYILNNFVADRFLLIPDTYLSENIISVTELLLCVLPLPILFVLLIILAYQKNVTVYQKAYL